MSHKPRILTTNPNPNTRILIEKAREAGYELIIANAYDTVRCPVKLLADEHYEVDASDTAAIAALAKEQRIDGIFTTDSDAHLRFYADICEATGFRAYCTKEQIRAISDKLCFKENCRRFGLKTTPEYPLPEKDSELSAWAEGLRYPVIVKAPDNSGGSKGMSVVYRKEEMPAALRLAKANSPTGSVIVEHYFIGDEFVVNYFFIDGEPYLLYTKDYCKGLENGQVLRDNAMISPSCYEDLLLGKGDLKLRAMLREVGPRYGIIFMQCFVEDGELYFFEGGCRAGGIDEYLLWERLYGIDFIKLLLRFSLTGNYGSAEEVEALKKTLSGREQHEHLSVLNVMAKPGTIAAVSGVEDVQGLRGVLAATLLHGEGYEIAADGTSGRIVLRAMLAADSAAEYLALIGKIYATLRFTGTAGEELLDPPLRLAHWVERTKLA